MWGLRRFDLKELDIKGWDDPGEGLPPRWTHKARPEAEDAGPEEDAPGEQAPASSRQPPALWDFAHGDFVQMLEQAISRCVSKLARMQEERLSDMFHEQNILLDTSLRRFQNQLAEHAAAKAAVASAIPATAVTTATGVTTVTGVTMTSAVANIEAKVSRLVGIAEEGQSDLGDYVVQTKQAVRDAIGEKLDTTLKGLLEGLRTEVRSVPDQDTSETPAQETKRMVTQPTAVLHTEEQYPDEDEGEDGKTSHGNLSFRVPAPMKWFRSMDRQGSSQSETTRKSRLRRSRTKESWSQAVVRSDYFEVASGFFTVAHVLLMVVETDRSFGTPFPWSTQLAIESTFLGIYTAELLVRVGVERGAFFASKLNVLDLVLLLSGSIDVIALMAVSDGVLHAGPFRALRLLRLQRVLRLHRLFKLAPGTRLLLESLGFCSPVLLGSAVVVFVYVLVAAILVGTMVSTFLRDEADALSDDEIRYYRRNFGSVLRCMVTLYQSVTAGQEWAAIYDALAKVLDGYLRVPFIAYHFGFQFLLVNILNSVFVQKVMSSSTEDTQVALYNTYVRDRQDTTELLSRCEEKLGAGELMNYKELLDLMLDSNIFRLFDDRNIKFKEARRLHAMLAKPVPGQNPSDDWMHAVNRADYFETCMRLKHDHMVLDMVRANTSHRLHMEVLQEQGGRVNSALERVQRNLDVLSHRMVHPHPPFI